MIAKIFSLFFSLLTSFSLGHAQETKLGLVPGKDVSFLTTGIQSSIEKVLLVLEGRVHATLGSGDIAARRQLLKEHPAKPKRF